MWMLLSENELDAGGTWFIYSHHNLKHKGPRFGAASTGHEGGWGVITSVRQGLSKQSLCRLPIPSFAKFGLRVVC